MTTHFSIVLDPMISQSFIHHIAKYMVVISYIALSQDGEYPSWPLRINQEHNDKPLYLVGGFNPSEKYQSVGINSFQSMEKIMFQTTNQLYQPFLFLVNPPHFTKSLAEKSPGELQSGAPLGHLCRKPRLGMTWTVTPYGGSPGYPKATQKSWPNSWLDG